MLKEQTAIAKELGISMNSLRRILRASNIEQSFILIENKRHYDYADVVSAIQGAVNGYGMDKIT